MRGRRLADSDSPDYTATRSEDPVQSQSPFRPNITSLVGLANAPYSVVSQSRHLVSLDCVQDLLGQRGLCDLHVHLGPILPTIRLDRYVLRSLVAIGPKRGLKART